jgi:hypothetical protein
VHLSKDFIGFLLKLRNRFYVFGNTQRHTSSPPF